jgi:hypothetical protein
MNGIRTQFRYYKNKRILFSKFIQSYLIKIIYKVMISHFKGREHSVDLSVHRKLRVILKGFTLMACKSEYGIQLAQERVCGRLYLNAVIKAENFLTS